MVQAIFFRIRIENDCSSLSGKVNLADKIELLLHTENDMFDKLATAYVRPRYV